MEIFGEYCLLFDIFSLDILFAEFHLAELLLFVAVVAANDAECSVYGMEDGGHWLVVGDTLRVVAFHDAFQRVRSSDRFLLHDFVVLDNTQSDVWSDNGEAVDFLVSEIFVSNLDDSLLANLFGRQVVADGDRGVHLLQLEQVDNLICLFGRYMVDYGSILYRRNH